MSAACITVVATPALAPVLPELGREFERLSGCAVVARYATAGAMGEAVDGADVAISTSAVVHALQSNGRIGAAGRQLGHFGLGVQIRKGRHRPGIGTVEALRCAILAAATIGYIDPATGAAAGVHAARIMRELDIAGAVAAKTRFLGGAALLDAVANDEVELGFAPVTEILSDARVALVGPVPSALQEMTVLTAAVIAASVSADRARAFIDFLAGDAAMAVLARRGVIRPGSRSP